MRTKAQTKADHTYYLKKKQNITTIQISKNLRDELKILGEKLDCNMNELIKRALNMLSCVIK